MLAQASQEKFKISIIIRLIRVAAINHLLTAGVAVEGEQVGGAAGDAGDGVGGGQVPDAVAHGDAAGEAAEATEVSSQTSNVRRSHGGSADGVLSKNCQYDLPRGKRGE